MGTRAARCPVDDFERGRLPLVCAVTGDRADGWYRETYESRPGALYLLLLGGVVPYLVVRMLTRRTALGRIPVSAATFDVLHRRAAARRRRTVTLGVLAGAIAVVGIAVAWFEPQVGGPVVLGGVVLGLAAILFDARSFLGGHVEPSGRWVVIEGAHPAFAAAVEAQARRG